MLLDAREWTLAPHFTHVQTKSGEITFGDQTATARENARTVTIGHRRSAAGLDSSGISASDVTVA